MKRNTTSTMLYLCLPQFFVDHPGFYKTCVSAANECVFWLTTIDEVHLHIQHSQSFRDEIRELREVFFQPIFHKRMKNNHPKLLLTSGTLYKNYAKILLQQTTVRITNDCIQWYSLSQFQQRRIHMKFTNSNTYMAKLDMVVKFAKEHDVHYACVFCGSKKNHIIFLSTEGLVHGSSSLAPCGNTDPYSDTPRFVQHNSWSGINSR